jgi:hypothetical protein
LLRIQWIPEVQPPGLTLPEREAGYSPLSNTEFKKASNFTSTTLVRFYGRGTGTRAAPAFRAVTSALKRTVFYITTRRCITEEFTLHTVCCESIKYYRSVQFKLLWLNIKRLVSWNNVMETEGTASSFMNDFGSTASLFRKT